MKTQMYNLKVVDIKDENDGSAIVVIEVDESFVEWFCQYHGIDEFSKETFNEWVSKVLADYVSKHR